jgi:hypothetical protein
MKPKITVLACALAFAGIARGAVTPIPLDPSSYNADVVVEKTATPVLVIATTASIDAGTNNFNATLFEQGFDTSNPANGLPSAGSTITALDDATHSFTMPPSYSSPNGILIDTVVSNGTFTLTTPDAYSKLSFLGLGGNGGDVISVRINHQDGTFETGSFGCPDWFGGSGVAVIMNGRLSSTVNLNAETDGTSGDSRGNPRVYFRDVTLTNITSPVTSLVLSYSSGSASSHNDILAVSGATTSGGPVNPIAVTGYTYDFVAEANASHRGRVVSTTLLDGTNVWATSQSIDNTGNTANSFYEQGYNINNPGSGAGAPIPDTTVFTNSGLPTAGSTISNAVGDHVYILPASYTDNNVCYLSPSNVNATITFASPATASLLSFLACAGNGPASPVAVVHHQDGSSETNSITISDWFNQTPPYVFGANGRVAVDTAQFNNVRNSARTPRLFNCDLVLNNADSPITSVDLTYTNTGGRVAIFAVSGSTDAVIPLFTVNPQSIKVNTDVNVSFSALATANAPVTYQWQRGTNGVFANLVDGGNISGATGTTLAINNVSVSDIADYRCVATDAAGSANSGVASLVVISPLQDVTQPSDNVAIFNGSAPVNENATHAIDNLVGSDPGKYLNFGLNGGTPFLGPIGLTVIPSLGRTFVTGLRFYTANDSSGRDPADYELYGSLDGGAHYTLISSNSLALPDARNSAASGPLDPLNQAIQQVLFTNDVSYSSYKLTFTHVKNDSGNNSMQIGDIEFLGTADTANPSPFFSVQPTPQAVYNESGAFFFASANGTPSPEYQWQKGTNGVYVNLTDGGNISGSQSSSLSINPATFSDMADYICVATNNAGSAVSSAVRLLVVSTNVDVTVPSDTITEFGDTTGTRNGDNANPANAIDDFNTTTYINGGSGLNATAGFPPFGGPVGLIVTPSVGNTIVTGLRVYTSDGVVDTDPADYEIEGSHDGGASYTLLSSGALDLPSGRSDNNFAFDPTVQPMQEVLFNNNTSYTSYRITFNHTKNDNTAESLQLGEIELLGVPGTTASQPNIASIVQDGANVVVSGSGGGANGTYYVLTTTNLAAPIINWESVATNTFDESGNFSFTHPVDSTSPQRFFLIQSQ